MTERRDLRFGAGRGKFKRVRRGAVGGKGNWAENSGAAYSEIGETLASDMGILGRSLEKKAMGSIGTRGVKTEGRRGNEVEGKK